MSPIGTNATISNAGTFSSDADAHLLQNEASSMKLH